MSAAWLQCCVAKTNFWAEPTSAIMTLKMTNGKLLKLLFLNPNVYIDWVVLFVSIMAIFCL